MALKQSESSKRGLSALPQVEKTLDDLAVVKQADGYLTMERPLLDHFSVDVNDLDAPESRPLNVKNARKAAFMLADDEISEEASAES